MGNDKCHSVLKGSFITARKRSLGQGNVLSSVCQGFCSQGGMCGDGGRGAWRVACLVRGHAWRGVCVVGVWGAVHDGGMHGGGVCMVGGGVRGGGGSVCGRYYEIQSMSERYASYCNVFSLLLYLAS